MKSRIMVVAIVIAATLTLTRANAQQHQTIIKREVKQLLANAASREDHLKLAAYYTQETNRFTAEAQKHESEAVTREKNPNYFAVKNPAAFGPQHCRDAANRLHREAAKAQSQIEQHNDMAQKVER